MFNLPRTINKNPIICYGLFFLILFFLASGIYWHSLNFYFFDDDFAWLSRAQGILLGTFSVMSRFSGFFMPMINIHFTFLYTLFDTNPFWFHLSNVFLHAINAFLLFFLTKKISNNTKVALIACLYFLVARYSMEAIVWISAATVLLSCTVLLSGGLCWFNFLKNGKKGYYILTIILALLSFSLKEWAVLYLPFLMIVTLFGIFKGTLEKQSLKKLFIYCLPIIFVFVLYGLWQFIFFKTSSSLVSGGYYAIGWHILKNICLNFLLLFLPLVNLAKKGQMLFTGGALLFLVILLLLSRLAKVGKEIKVSILWIVLALMPTALFVKWSFVSRYSYLPMIGAAWIVGIIVVALLEYSNKKYWQITVVSTLILAMLVNIFFIQRMLIGSVSPIYTNTYQLVEELNVIPSRAEGVNFYQCNFIQVFLLSKAARAMYWRQDFKVNEMFTTALCPKGEECWYWDYFAGHVKKIMGTGANNPYYSN